MTKTKSKKISTENVPVSEILVNKDFMMRDELDKKVVAEYKDNLDTIIESSPIVVYDTNNGLLLVDGFHRLTAAKQLNWEKIKAKVVGGSVQEAFAYACMANLRHGKPLTPTERKRAICEIIKLNVKDSNPQIGKIVGVSETTIFRYRRALEDAGEIEPQETRVGADNKTYDLPTASSNEEPEFVVDPFDEWLENHVVCDDIFNALQNDQLMYDLIIVDPPYGITKEEWDDKTRDELLVFTRKWLNVVLGKLKPSGRMFVFWSRKYLLELKPLMDEIENEHQLNFGGVCVWNFRNSLTKPNNQKELQICWEPVFYFYGMDAPDLNRPDTELTGEKWDGVDSDVWTYAIPQSNYKDTRVHPTQKPIELYKHIIKLTTNTNDLILDPFAGSGTTGHAAYELGREFRLIEKDPGYVNLIRNRLQPIFREDVE